VGGYLPLLSATFERVTAVDYSRRCVEQARAAHGALLNVEVQTTGWLAAPAAPGKCSTRC